MKSISRNIRVVFKDVSPLIHEQMPANLRSVSIRLTEEQSGDPYMTLHRLKKKNTQKPIVRFST